MATYEKWIWSANDRDYRRKVTYRPFGFVREVVERLTLKDVLAAHDTRLLRMLNTEPEPTVKLDDRPFGPYRFSVEEMQAEIERRKKEPDAIVTWNIGTGITFMPVTGSSPAKPKKGRKKK